MLIPKRCFHEREAYLFFCVRQRKRRTKKNCQKIIDEKKLPPFSVVQYYFFCTAICFYCSTPLPVEFEFVLFHPGLLFF